MRSPHHVTRTLLALGVAAVLVALRPGPPVLANGNSVWSHVGEITQELGQEKLKKLMEGAEKATQAVEKGADLSKSWDELSPDDSQYEPDYAEPGMPELPALCKDAPQCEECFANPYAQLNSLRFRFEKLRKVNRSTKNMLRDAIAFGDAAASAAGGLAGLAWAKEKEGIRASEANFNAAYDAKLEELLGTLKTTLQAIAACEEKVFGEQSWYERYGFIYYQFMAEAYRRPD